MSQRSRSKSQTQVTLFPFMAVLLCTMGALILLLVVIAKNVRDNSLLAADSEADNELLQKHAQEAEDAVWLTQGLQNSLAESQENIAELKSKLIILEEQIRRLSEKYRQTLLAAQDLDNKRTPDDIAALERELSEKKRLLDEKQTELKKKQAEHANRKSGYAIVPYRGHSATNRYPIYVECKNDTIIVQPEGIVLYPVDFAAASLKSGTDLNPLDAGVRAATAYLMEIGQIPQGASAYPLLVVRPSGIEGYSIAAAVLSRSNNDFGYELIAEDTSLEFPSKNEEMRQRMLIAINRTREEISTLLTAASMSMGEQTKGQRYTVDQNGRPKMLDSGDGTNKATEAAKEIQNIARNTPSVKFDVQNELQNELKLEEQRNKAPIQSETPLSESIAKSKGENWGLKGAARNTIAITRPVKIICEPNRLILPEQIGLFGGAKIVPINDSLREATLELAKEIQAYTDSWGTAGERRYWRPLLKINVLPGAEHVFQEVQRLLEGSGFLIEVH